MYSCFVEGRRYGRTAMTMMITDLEVESDQESEEEPVAKRSKTVDSSESEILVSWYL